MHLHGYDMKLKAYRLFNHLTKKIIRSRNVDLKNRTTGNGRRKRKMSKACFESEDCELKESGRSRKLTSSLFSTIYASNIFKSN